MEIIAHQGFGEWVCIIFAGVYLPHLHKIVSNITPLKMLAKHHGFFVQGDTRISCVQHHTHDFHKYSSIFKDLDTHGSKVVLDHNRLSDSLLQRCEIST